MARPLYLNLGCPATRNLKGETFDAKQTMVAGDSSYA